MTFSIAGAMARAEAREAEHRRCMAENPAYHAQVEAEEARRRAEEAARLAAERERCRGRAGIPHRFRRLLDGKLDDTEALRVTRDFLADRFACFLVLAGPTGVGKTVAAGWFLEDATSSRFVAAIDLVRRGMFGEDARFWDEARGAGRLVIDDLGTEPLDPKGYAYANLAALLAHRHATESKTLITSNLDVETFRARYLTADGGRLADRMRECGTFYEVRGASLRRPRFLGGA